MEENNNGGPAFPACAPDTHDPTGRRSQGFYNEGMTLRDYFAAKAMTGDWAAQSSETGLFILKHGAVVFEPAAAMYYRMADAMLAARDAT